MTQSSVGPVVHALVFCRDIELGKRGEVTLKNVLEVLPVESFPSDAGPLTIVAFVRDLPVGTGEGAFVLRAPGSEGEPLGAWRLEMEVQEAHQGRQQCINLQVPKLVVNEAGWYEVAFFYNERELASNRFLVGVLA
ncbi:MAG: hypothetical protein QNJ98_14005 [Planctomycetota bacterium]|nr:hypothetical protein [Planctomycetota bacterium]